MSENNQQHITGKLEYTWLYLIKGIAYIALAAWIITHPSSTFMALSNLFVAIMLFGGVIKIYFATKNHKAFGGWGWQLISGVVDVLIGIMMLTHPQISEITLTLMIGFWLILLGMNMTGSAFHLKDIGKKGWGLLLIGGLTIIVIAFAGIVKPNIIQKGSIYLIGLSAGIAGILNIILSGTLKYASYKYEKNNTKDLESSKS